MLFWKRNRASSPTNGSTSRWPDLLAAIQKSDVDLMVVVGPEDGGSVCTDWIGAVVSVSGNDHGFPALVDALEDGIFHPNCRHKLIPYRTEEGEAAALFCTKLAIAGMNQRQQSTPVPETAPLPTGEQPRAYFTRCYDLARNAEQSRLPEMALRYCQEAIMLLTRREVFGDDQAMIQRVLKGRMQTILRAHQHPSASGAVVE